MYDILADFDFDYCHGILYRLRVLALVFYDVLFTCYVFSVVCLFPRHLCRFFLLCAFVFCVVCSFPGIICRSCFLCAFFAHLCANLATYSPFRAFFLFEYHHPYKNRKHPVNDLLLAPFI